MAQPHEGHPTGCIQKIRDLTRENARLTHALEVAGAEQHAERRELARIRGERANLSQELGVKRSELDGVRRELALRESEFKGLITALRRSNDELNARAVADLDAVRGLVGSACDPVVVGGEARGRVTIAPGGTPGVAKATPDLAADASFPRAPMGKHLEALLASLTTRELAIVAKMTDSQVDGICRRAASSVFHGICGELTPPHGTRAPSAPPHDGQGRGASPGGSVASSPSSSFARPERSGGMRADSPVPHGLFGSLVPSTGGDPT